MRIEKSALIAIIAIIIAIKIFSLILAPLSWMVFKNQSLDYLD